MAQPFSPLDLVQLLENETCELMLKLEVARLLEIGAGIVKNIIPDNSRTYMMMIDAIQMRTHFMHK